MLSIESSRYTPLMSLKPLFSQQGSILIYLQQVSSLFIYAERVQKGIAYWDKQDNDVPAPNCMLKVQGEIIKVEGL